MLAETARTVGAELRRKRKGGHTGWKGTLENTVDCLLEFRFPRGPPGMCKQQRACTAEPYLRRALTVWICLAVTTCSEKRDESEVLRLPQVLDVCPGWIPRWAKIPPEASCVTFMTRVLERGRHWTTCKAQ